MSRLFTADSLQSLFTAERKLQWSSFGNNMKRLGSNFTADYDKSDTIDSAWSLGGRDWCVQSSDVTLHEGGCSQRTICFAMRLSRLIELFPAVTLVYVQWAFWLEGVICQTRTFVACYSLSVAKHFAGIMHCSEFRCVCSTLPGNNGFHSVLCSMKHQSGRLLKRAWVV